MALTLSYFNSVLVAESDKSAGLPLISFPSLAPPIRRPLHSKKRKKAPAAGFRFPPLYVLDNQPIDTRNLSLALCSVLLSGIPAMVQATGEERAVHLAREAVELFDAGHREVSTVIDTTLSRNQ